MCRLAFWVACGLCFILTATPHAQAWNGYGHSLIAAIAWQQLTPAERTKLSSILANHPRPEPLTEKQAAGVDSNFQTFVRAATWPDLIKSGPNRWPEQDRRDWHFVDFPISFDNARGKSSQPTWDGRTEPKNTLQALSLVRERLTDAKADPGQRAIYLCWALHLIGDLHQPLHAASLFSADFPTGDRGGNSFIVTSGTQEIDLHSVWDGMLGSSKSVRAIVDDASKIASDTDLSRDALEPLLTNDSPEGWAKESNGLAEVYVYRRGELKGLTRKGATASGPRPPALRVDYMQESRRLARKQAAVAGYRLADWLRARLAEIP